MRSRCCRRYYACAVLGPAVQVCKRLTLVSVASISIGMLVGSVYGQSCEASTPLRLVDRRGQPVANITRDQLRVKVNGTPVTVRSLEPVTKPGVVLILDVSPSMKKTWKQSMAAAKQLVEAVGENVDLFAFDMGISAYAVGRSKSEDLLDRLLQQGAPNPPRGTALYDTLIEVARRVTTHNATIVVITDGGDNASYHSSDATASLFLSSSWPPVFALVLDYEETNTRRGYFKKIPAATGGLILYPASASKVSSTTKELADVVLNPIAMGLQLSQPTADSAKLEVEVVGENGRPSKEINVLHAAKLTACNPHEPTPH
jgi:VWA domain-containing protein